MSEKKPLSEKVFTAQRAYSDAMSDLDDAVIEIFGGLDECRAQNWSVEQDSAYDNSIEIRMEPGQVMTDADRAALLALGFTRIWNDDRSAPVERGTRREIVALRSRLEAAERRAEEAEKAALGHADKWFLETLHANNERASASASMCRMFEQKWEAAESALAAERAEVRRWQDRWLLTHRAWQHSAIEDDADCIECRAALAPAGKCGYPWTACNSPGNHATDCPRPPEGEKGGA